MMNFLFLEGKLGESIKRVTFVQNTAMGGCRHDRQPFAHLTGRLVPIYGIIVALKEVNECVKYTGRSPLNKSP